MNQEHVETDEIIRLQAEQAVKLHQLMLEAKPFEDFVSKGHLEWLKKNVFVEMERELILMVKGLDFVPNSIAQVAHMKGQLETLDRIESRILGRIQEANNARQKLLDLQHSTPNADE